MSTNTIKIPAIEPSHLAAVENYGATITPLEPLGAKVEGIDLASKGDLPAEVVDALERVMAQRGFIVFKNEQALTVEEFLDASCLWGGKEIHSTHGVHPATPGGNRHIFRLSNDGKQGVLGVGPQWHNDGSFNTDTFSHTGLQAVSVAKHGGGTYFSHQGAAFDALAQEKKEFWSRLVSVNSASGVLHPLVHKHPITNRESIWLHLGMTGAVIEKLPEREGFRLLQADELKKLCLEYNDILTAGLDNGYASLCEYEENDIAFFDNLAVSHKAAPEAHMPTWKQGLRIMHRSTVRGQQDLAPGFGLPLQLDIGRASPFGEGVWQIGSVGFRWDDGIPMQN